MARQLSVRGTQRLTSRARACPRECLPSKRQMASPTVMSGVSYCLNISVMKAMEKSPVEIYNMFSSKLTLCVLALGLPVPLFQHCPYYSISQVGLHPWCRYVCAYFYCLQSCVHLLGIRYSMKPVPAGSYRRRSFNYQSRDMDVTVSIFEEA